MILDVRIADRMTKQEILRSADEWSLALIENPSVPDPTPPQQSAPRPVEPKAHSCAILRVCQDGLDARSTVRRQDMQSAAMQFSDNSSEVHFLPHKTSARRVQMTAPLLSAIIGQLARLD